MNTLQQGMVLHGKSREYKIEKVLGQGSFGITYLATTKVQVQESLGSLQAEMKVAVKEFFMKDLNGREGTRVTSFSSGGKEGLCEKYKAKFIKESQNLSKLQHPGIVKVLESFEANGTAYYVMEYCEGGNLDELIKSKGGLGEGEAKSLACKIGDALSYMHSRGMLHLDLKPGNIMLRADGTPVVIDFGLSKQYTADGKAENSTTVGLGTPGYAPIEQGDYQESKGKFPVTMDVYAFGATVFKMLTGNTPPKASEIMNHGFPAYELQDKNVSITTIRAIKKAMESKVSDRCQSVAEFVRMGELNIIEELEEWDESYHYSINVNTNTNQRTEITPTDPFPRSQEPTEPPFGFVNRDKTGIEKHVCTIQGHEYVDLGLSVKWATCNVGANAPHEYGDYFAWGETETKRKYIAENCKTIECIKVRKGFLKLRIETRCIDKRENFKDTARSNWGGSWRLPTRREMEELVNKCTWTWTTQSGVNGYKVTGPNGNSIFLPAAGYCDGSSRDNVGGHGYYWNSTPDGSRTYEASDLSFFRGRRWMSESSRDYGHTVRPVSE